MKNNIYRTQFLSGGYFVYKLLLLNIITIGLTFLLSLIRNLLEHTDLLLIRFPIEMFGIAFVLSNFIYLIGNLFEFIHAKLWDRQFGFKEHERKMFKVGLIIVTVIHIAGIIIYLINF